MGISLTPEQEGFVLSKLQTGQYRSAEELLEVALQLLEAHDRAEAKWVEDVREKIDAAIAASEHAPPVDGTDYVARTLERLRQVRQERE
ncbi:ribbon-helix-helix domain-containing protein [Gloeobacter violaceus]|uniref:Gsl1911 protein n=1 Tax=Gloeobacter violaceus (strain ATCC 29082 / PCC 7421) TaxID=251221 RepID=Q7NJC1_GLOVI|nr:type II toxin-antitoxin system ParD family antitoxin [Gloeobacter violaceus]BAC89852.1 gsl1911 [Gloeobacter violaceus PCC 7421]